MKRENPMVHETDDSVLEANDIPNLGRRCARRVPVDATHADAHGDVSRAESPVI